jgi:hypothetical protein
MIETVAPATDQSLTPQLMTAAVDTLAFPSDPAPEIDPNVFVLATTFGPKGQLAALLKVAPSVVEQMEKDRQLFGLMSRSKRYRVYGLYQALPEVAGQPLETILVHFFKAMDSGETWMQERHIGSFFRAPNNMLAWATPLEVLLGHRLYDAPIEREAAWLYRQDADVRLRAVLGAAHDELMHRRAFLAAHPFIDRVQSAVGTNGNQRTEPMAA